MRQDPADVLSVCHLASGDRWAGAECQVATVVRALARRGDVRVCVIVLNEGRLADEIRSAGVEVALLPQREISFGAIYSRAYEFLRDKRVQVLHSHRYKENLLAFLLRPRLGRPYLVRTQHGSPELLTRKDRMVYALDRLTGRRVHKVVSVSSQVQGYLGRYLRPAQIAVIRNGIDLDQVRSSLTRGQARQRLGIAPDTPVVGSVARLDPVKRQDLFLETASEILRDLPSAMFVIAGAGQEEANLRTLAQSLGISNQVRFLGYRSDSNDVLRAMDILLMTSDHEGLPMVVLEAMALGPVVVSRHVGGIPEAVEHDRDGVLVDSSEPRSLAAACLTVLRDESRRAELAGAAHTKVTGKFSSEANAEHVVQLYRSLLTGSVAPSLAVEHTPIAAGSNR